MAAGERMAMADDGKLAIMAEPRTPPEGPRYMDDPPTEELAKLCLKA